MEKVHLSELIINIDDYEILSELGSGGCGTVYKARDKNTGKLVALKILIKSNQMFDDQKKLQNFMREVIVPSMLHIPGIVHLIGFRFPLSDNEIDIYPEPAPVYINGVNAHIDLSGAVIITELLENSSLDKIINKYINSGPTPEFGPTQISKIIFGVAANMAIVHSKNIIHRDLKLDNIFLDSNYEPRIADFGLAKVVNISPEMTMAIGTPLYMAPELFGDGDEYDVSVDVYAFAVLVYKLFENRNYLSDGTPINSFAQLYKKVTSGKRLIKTERIPDLYWDLIERCWSQAPSKRPSFAEITEMLKDDKYAVKGYGMETDLEELHAYQDKITSNKSDEKETIDFNQSMAMVINMSKIGTVNSTTGSIYDGTNHNTTNALRKTVFNWKRH